jgi:hypothetical protein
MARGVKWFKSDLTKGDAIWIRDIRPYVYKNQRREDVVVQQKEVIYIESLSARIHGMTMPKDLEFLIPMVAKMGFKIKESVQRNGSISYKAIGLSRTTINSAYPTRFQVPDTVIEYMDRHTKNQLFKMMMKLDRHDWSTIEYMKAPILPELNDHAGFEPDFLEITM